MKHVIRPAAREDILKQFRHYLGEDAVDAAARFLNAVDRSIAELCRMPEMGAPRPLKNGMLEGLRSWPVKDFADIRIYYLIQDDILRVVGILHGKRDVAATLENEKPQ